MGKGCGLVKENSLKYMTAEGKFWEMMKYNGDKSRTMRKEHS